MTVPRTLWHEYIRIIVNISTFEGAEADAMGENLPTINVMLTLLIQQAYPSIACVYTLKNVGSFDGLFSQQIIRPLPGWAKKGTYRRDIGPGLK